MTKKSDAPAIRFKGFSDAWEQRKLGDISEIKTGPFGSTLHADDYVSDGTPIITTEHFKTGALPRSKNGLPQVSDSDYKRLTAYTLDAGDIVFSRVGSVDINALITPFQSNWLFSGRVLRVRPQTDVSSQFLHTRLETESIKTDIRTRAVGQTMPSINTEILKITPLVLPSSVAEQEQIGSYFAALDNLITLHQRKFEKLTNVKKSMLEKMFPQNGSSYPEIRFKGFTDPWEQRKLSEMCGTFEYGLNAAAKEFDGKNKYIRITDIDDASREFLLSDLSSPDICLDGMSKYILSSGDIVFARTGASVGKTYIYRENDGIVYFAGFLIRAKVNQDNDAEFVFQSTLSPSYEKYIRITSQRSGQPGVNAQEYGEYDLFAPSKEEQQRIGHFLRGIDNLITLHQRELKKLQNIKKSMLEKMFV